MADTEKKIKLKPAEKLQKIDDTIGDLHTAVNRLTADIANQKVTRPDELLRQIGLITTSLYTLDGIRSELTAMAGVLVARAKGDAVPPSKKRK